MAAAICPYWMPDAVTKASAPTVTGCLSADARIRAKTKLFRYKMVAVVISALSTAANRSTAAKAGADEFVAKPFLPEDLAALVARLTEPK